MTSKVLTPVTDKNGVKTARWKNPQANSSERAQAVGAPATAVSDAIQAPATVDLRDSGGIVRTVPTNRWTNDAEYAFIAGQCAALGAALKDIYPDATLKAMTNMSGNTLIHVWLEEDGMITDAAGYAHTFEEEYLDEMYYLWGTPEIVEHTQESLKAWMEEMSPGGQNWEGAEWMVDAWLAEHEG